MLNKMRSLYFYAIVSLLILPPTTSFAQSTKDSIPNANKQNDGNDYEMLYKKELQVKSSLLEEKENLREEEKILDKSLAALTKELNAKQTKLNSLTKKLQKSQSDGKNSKLTNLLKEKEELEKSNKALSEKLATLDASIKSSTALLNNNQQQLINLENIQEKVSNDILRENGDYLKLPFSKMKDSDLLKIKEKCANFSDDENVKKLLLNTEKCMENKRVYDNIITALNSPFNKENIFDLQRKAKSLDGLNQVQKEEISAYLERLSHFENGLAALKEFITNINKNRKGVNYDVSFYQDDKKIIFGHNSLGKRIEMDTMQIPYLKKVYLEFEGMLKKYPNKHTPIENELLKQ